jgi:murein DD-endopeptidase MepM/ murein hydrolase activator NlpD
MESIKNRLTGIGRWFAGLWDRLFTGIKGMLNSREARMRAGYYMGLALLLALLGLGSHAWRMRGQSGEEASMTPPRAAMAVGVATQSPAPSATPEPVLWAWPLEGEIVAEYAPDAPVWSETLGQWQTHPALDIAGSPGEAVYACRDGVVSEAWKDRLWGNVILVEHDDGYQSTYAGLNTLNMVAEGDAVGMGQVIGSVGQSASCEAERGWHLHFELTRDGEPVDFKTLVP